MPKRDLNLSETDIRSPKSEAWIVRADADDSRDWLKDSPVCRALTNFQIRHLAVAHMPAPFEIVRTKLGGSYFLATFSGEGRVLIDGRWARCRPGQAMLLPPSTLQAFQTPTGKRWDFCWVRYQERSGQKPLASARTPVVAELDAEPLRLAILGLHRECSNDGSLSERWAELIHSYVTQFAQPAQMDSRLWRLWDEVASSLDQAWTITEMARRVHLSDKQLQRLCLRELGRSPRQQLIWLRMRRAAELLPTEAKIEAISREVGYQNPFVFSTTFKRVMGWSPSTFPGRARPSQ
ncbi:MAG: response regulator receiver domain-containing protein (CheY-like) [Planctomycetota bacterium]|nr:MAG: response regulator receiver domain-containing protein (CheY-like) [Planctomycetota bacterium]